MKKWGTCEKNSSNELDLRYVFANKLWNWSSTVRWGVLNMQCTQLCHSTWKTGNDRVDHNHHGFCHFDAKSILSFCDIGQLIWKVLVDESFQLAIMNWILQLHTAAAWDYWISEAPQWVETVHGQLVTKPWPWQGHEGAASDNGVEVDLRWPCIPCIPLWYTTIQYDSNDIIWLSDTIWLYDFFTSHLFTYFYSNSLPLSVYGNPAPNSLHGRVLSP